MIYQFFVVTMFILATATCSLGQDSAKTKAETLNDTDSDSAPSYSSEVEAGASMLELFASPDADEPLEMIRAYKWANTARKPLGDRLCLLYLDRGRPVASCKIYPTGRNIVHTPIAMTDGLIEGRIDGNVVWTPPPSEPKFNPLTSEQEPAANPAMRRIQMKRIVRSFKAITDKEEAERQRSVADLRLLPTPIHRYSSPELTKRGIIDGAVFCFVAEGGNPQVLMMLEAIEKKGKRTWQCGFSRRTFAELKVLYQESEIWRSPYLPGSSMAKDASFHRITSPNPVIAN